MDKYKIYDIKEVASILGVTPMTVWRYTHEHKLKSFKVGRLIRITEDMLDEFIRTAATRS